MTLLLQANDFIRENYHLTVQRRLQNRRGTIVFNYDDELRIGLRFFSTHIQIDLVHLFSRVSFEEKGKPKQIK